MKLSAEEEALRAGECGPAAQWAIEHQIRVGDYLGAGDFVAVSQAHIMADTKSLGVAGVEWLERMARLPLAARRLRVPTITDPRGTDFAAAHRLRQQPWMLELERRAIAAFEALGVLMTNTCINYQTIMPPVCGEHVAYGDTGVVIYCNSVCGARSNFEGGPSALSAALTGRTPRYGYHLDQRRRATLLVDVGWTPRELNDWGALGGIVGRLAGDYWQVPALVGIDRVPTSDEMKHFGAALASYGSVALFHMVGITPEAQRGADVVAARATLPAARGRRSRHSRLRGGLRARGRHRRSRRVLGAAAQPGRDAAIGRPARGSPRDHPAPRGDEPAGQARRRPAGPDRAHRGRRWQRALRHVLLPELCPRNGGGERLETASDELCQARQHHRRLWLPARAARHGRLRRCRLPRRPDRKMSGRIFIAAAGMGRRVEGEALVAKDGFSARYDLDRVRGVFSRPEHKLAGQSYVDRVLVLDAAKGGVATAWMLLRDEVPRGRVRPRWS